MNKLTITAVAATAVGAVVAPAYALAAPGSPGDRDIERHGTCHGAETELSVDREHNGFEVDGSIDHARPFSTWKMVLRHDGKVVAKKVQRTDDEGELDLERFRPNTKGKDVFKLRVKPVGGGKACVLKVRTR